MQVCKPVAGPHATAVFKNKGCKKDTEVYISTGYRLRYIQVNLVIVATGCDRSASLINLITDRYVNYLSASEHQRNVNAIAKIFNGNF